ncbi:hypothetical protein MW887_004188 [Aspergillus wentii]|nr:hypothetical protein MW887_004188 [Aspergillus wentii]
MNLSTLLLLCFTLVIDASPLRTRNNALSLDLARITSLLGHTQIGNFSLTNVTLPLSDTNPKLPPVSPGLTLKHVALGRGTQNYTCSSSDKTATPAANGALATLYDASYLASSYPKLLHALPAALVGLPVDAVSYLTVLLGQLTSPKSDSLVLGQHYFTSNKAPFFDLRLGGDKDWAAAKQNASVTAPSTSSSGSQDHDTKQDVSWLKLASTSGTGIKEVYRVQTYGGAAPSTCERQKGSFQVDYAAEYWFYG